MLNAASLGDVVTTSRAARELGVAENTIRGYADRGQLACIRVGSLRLYAVADVLRLRDLRAARRV